MFLPKFSPMYPYRGGTGRGGAHRCCEHGTESDLKMLVYSSGGGPASPAATTREAARDRSAQHLRGSGPCQHLISAQ